MSQNDHTGLESYTNDELVSETYRVFDDLLHPPLLMELAKRLEDEGDAAKQLAEIDRLGMSIADIEKLSGPDVLNADLLVEYSERLIDSHATTIALLDVLRDHDIESSETLRLILEAVSQIQKAA